MGIPTIFDKEFLFRKDRDIDASEDFEECLAKHRKEAGNDKEEQEKLDILQEEYKRENKEDGGATASGGNSKGRNEYVESLRPEKQNEDNTKKVVKNEQTKNEKVKESSDRQEQEQEKDDERTH